MDTYLKGRVRNFSLKPKRCLLPVFEAVMNSIQAIEDRASLFPDLPRGRIAIVIVRRQQQKELMQAGNLPPVIEVHVTDNGIGFDDRHLTAFSRLDDDFRFAKGGKGVGRVSWLSAFERVSIESYYQTGTDKLGHRTFDYSIDADGVENAKVTEVNANEHSPGTTVKLLRMKYDFQEAWPKKPSTVIERLVLHFQRFLALPMCPEIEFRDVALPNPVILGDYFRDQFQIDRLERTIEIGTEKFDVVHLLHRASGEASEQRHTVSMLANGRPAEEPQTIPMGHGIPKGPIRHEGLSLYYTAFVSGTLLDQSTNETRTHVDLATAEAGLFGDEIKREDIVAETAKSGRQFLGNRLDVMYEELQKRIEAICLREIRYRPLLTHCKDELKRLEPSLAELKLEDAIHAVYRDFMNRLRERTRNVSKRARQHIDDLSAFKTELKEIIGSWNEAAMSDLAAYVAHRRAVLWFLQERLKFTANDEYRFEEAVHAVFFPMGFDTDMYPVEAANLWLIDERLSFHEYLASDMALKKHKLLENESGNELDIAVYHAAHAFGAAELPRMNITLVEFKRPGRDKYSMEDNPYTQAIGYIEDIRSGTAKSRDGRPINDLRTVHFFVYIICDHSPALHRILMAFDFKETSDGRGYFKHTDHAYFEVLTFDKLIDDALSRN